MSVFDKELTINGKAVRSPEQQVWKNMKDIDELQKYIKEAYKCSGELNTASISVAKSLTNADASVKEGWLLDTVGSLFKITGGDDDSLLIEFYTSLRGPQGEDGAAVNIDDNTTSATKCWSSQKVNSELADISNNGLDKGVYYTNTQPTDDTTISSSALLNKNGYVPIQVNDLIIYINGNNNPTSIYKVYSISGTTITVVKLGDYASGGGHKVLRVYSEAINEVPDEYKWYVSASDINDYVIDLATGSVPASYNQGDIVIAVSYDEDTDNDYIDGVYIVNTSGLWGSAGDLLLELGMFAKSGGKQLYQHFITCTCSGASFTIVITDENNDDTLYNCNLDDKLIEYKQLATDWAKILKERKIDKKKAELEQDFVNDDVSEADVQVEKDSSDTPLPIFKRFAKNLLNVFKKDSK